MGAAGVQLRSTWRQQRCSFVDCSASQPGVQRQQLACAARSLDLFGWRLSCVVGLCDSMERPARGCSSAVDPDLKDLQSLLYLMRKAFRPFENLGPEGLAHSVLSMIGWQDILRN